MRFGFHISIAGGFKKVLERALLRECETIQIFSRNPRAWKYKEIDDDDGNIFKKQINENNIFPVFVHLPYLINLGSGKNRLFVDSVRVLIEELGRTEKLGAQFLITHCGSHSDKKAGIKRMIQAISRAFLKVNNSVILLIENTAGGGQEFGYNFEQLREIINGVGSKRIGVVFDTAHAFEAGYDLRTEKDVDKTIGMLDKKIGIERVYLVHFNDSLTEFNSRKDRHWHIGKGKIGKGMEFIIRHPLLRDLPFIMETPRTNTKEDLMNMASAKRMKEVAEKM